MYAHGDTYQKILPGQRNNRHSGTALLYSPAQIIGHRFSSDEVLKVIVCCKGDGASIKPEYTDAGVQLRISLNFILPIGGLVAQTMSTSKIPQLPPTGEASSIRYEVNPAIALNALTDIYHRVKQYQGQLRQLAYKIHQIYAEGPVVSGWLASQASLDAAAERSRLGNRETQPVFDTHSGQPTESTPLTPAADVALFRHGDADDLMKYLSALETAIDDSENNHSDAVDSSSLAEKTDYPSQYYLCQLTSSGQIQAEQCPSEQVPAVSMAIARYRRLNQLITQKQAIEIKLQTVTDILEDAQKALETS